MSLFFLVIFIVFLIIYYLSYTPGAYSTYSGKNRCGKYYAEKSYSTNFNYFARNLFKNFFGKTDEICGFVFFSFLFILNLNT